MILSVKILLVFIISLTVGLALAYPVIFLCQKLKAQQTVLHYVEAHYSKSGTPTMGGIIFILASLVGCACFLWVDCFYAWMSILVMLAFGLLGFLDDFIKVHFHQNEGLSPLQKIIGQTAIAALIAVLVYFKIGGEFTFFSLKFNIGWGIIPFAIVVILAVVNSVNLTDGLDGLAGGTSFVYLLFFGAIVALIGQPQQSSLSVAAFAVAGGVLAFLAVNTFPAKIFMGDTGSLALGGFIACLALFSGKVLYIPIMGLMFVLSALSDIIQVAHYKRTHKRVFLMAPLHHHFEKKGVHENRIVTIYIIVTSLLSAVCLCLEIAL